MEPFETREHLTVTHEGQKIFGIVHRPLTDGPAPCVLIAHGFAGNKIGHRRLYVMLAEALARQGIATLRFDHRGCGDSEGGFSQVTMESLVSDALQALSILSDLPGVDSQRLGILGVSLGGPVSIRTAHQHGQLSSLALWAPVANGPQWETDFNERYPCEDVQEHITSGGEMVSFAFREQFLEIRMDEEVRQLNGLPLLHIHGERDEVVFTNHADIYQQARTDAYADSAFHRFPHSNHNFSIHAAERQQLVELTADWFKKTLL
jgi:uncharacterized protein